MPRKQFFMSARQVFVSLIVLWSTKYMCAMADITIVENGMGKSVIVIPEKPSEFTQKAAQEFVDHVKLATGVHLKTVSDGKWEQYAKKSIACIHIGPTNFAKTLMGSNSLQPGQYKIIAKGNHIVIVGHDVDIGEPGLVYGENHSPATAWGVYRVLDEVLGVRWLWPGKLGTFVPKAKTITIPEMELSGGPKLIVRRMHIGLQRHGIQFTLIDNEQRSRLTHQAVQWCKRHQMGIRTAKVPGAMFEYHAFSDWWDRFHKTHPDYFAVPPEGWSQPFPHPKRVKLRLSNPAVADQIVEDWKEVGAPEFWNVGPNDGQGFCTDPATMAMDEVQGGQDPVDIWRSRGDTTGRYVRFWNELLRRMRQINPKVKLYTLAYSSYRFPPRKLSLRDGMIVAFVPDALTPDDAYLSWRGWSDAGARLILRPNWGHDGYGAPHLGLDAVDKFMRFAYRNNMEGFDFDTLLGYWSTEGPFYYMIARRLSRPELSLSTIKNEYASAFGQAAPHILKYLDYWQQFDNNRDERVLRLAKKHGLDHFPPLYLRYRVMPFLYTGQVIDKAFVILDRAKEAVTGEDQNVVHKRIQFLADGLHHLRQLNAVIEVNILVSKNDTHENRQLLKKEIILLQNMRRELTPRHVVWGDVANWMEAKRRIVSSDWKGSWPY